MTALEAFQKSNAWDSQHELPNSPMNNNPWFYTALAVKLITMWDYKYPVVFTGAILNFIKGCESRDDIGLFDRWPDKTKGGCISQDELIGIAYLNRDAALRIATYLFHNDGVYINPASGAWDAYKTLPKELLEGRQDMYRFYWLMPYIQAAAGLKVSILSQFKYGLYLLTDMFTTKKGSDDASGRLLRFVMNEKMEKFYFSNIFVQLWRMRMKKLEITPKAMLTLEPAENPVFAEHAPEAF